MTPTAVRALTTPERIGEEVERLVAWVTDAGGIAHRGAAENAGFSMATRRAAVRCGAIRRVRRNWLATDAAPLDLLTAAESGGTLTCVSAARRRGWWLPDDVPRDIHVGLDPHASSPVPAVTAHWSQRLPDRHWRR